MTDSEIVAQLLASKRDVTTWTAEERAAFGREWKRVKALADEMWAVLKPSVEALTEAIRRRRTKTSVTS